MDGHHLTAETEKIVIGGKRVTAVYLVPEGYELGEDNGYVITRRIGTDSDPTSSTSMPNRPTNLPSKP